jgi:hypothetical protein
MARRRRPSEDPPSRGTVHPLLDLHGLTGGEARTRADSWLRARAAEGERTVVVVTGRGNRSHGLPVLRGEVEDVLLRLQGEVVTGWEEVDGGGGFRVRLRPPAAPTRSSVPLTAYPPELRRRAEEALDELGIAPTPELVRAEIRRLLAEADDPPAD